MRTPAFLITCVQAGFQLLHSIPNSSEEMETNYMQDSSMHVLVYLMQIFHPNELCNVVWVIFPLSITMSLQGHPWPCPGGCQVYFICTIVLL